jgi:hypothetical protein
MFVMFCCASKRAEVERYPPCALSISASDALFKATSKEIQARVTKGMAIGSALQSINQFVG